MSEHKYSPLEVAIYNQNLARYAGEVSSRKEEICLLTEMVEAAKRQADTAVQQAARAEEDAKSSDLEAKRAVRQSRISNAIAAAALIASILQWLLSWL